MSRFGVLDDSSIARCTNLTRQFLVTIPVRDLDSLGHSIADDLRTSLPFPVLFVEDHLALFGRSHREVGFGTLLSPGEANDVFLCLLANENEAVGRLWAGEVVERLSGLLTQIEDRHAENAGAIVSLAILGSPHTFLWQVRTAESELEYWHPLPERWGLQSGVIVRDTPLSFS